MKICKASALVLLLLHYWGITHNYHEAGIPGEVEKAWDVRPGFVTLFCIFYLSGQIWIWWQLLKKRAGTA